MTKDKTIPKKDVKTRYGIGQGAEFRSKGDETDPQEYKSEGLPQLDKYSVDKPKKKSKFSDDGPGLRDLPG